jgi:hypothetical protein
MQEMPQRSTLRALWLGFVLALAAVLCNAAFFINPPLRRAIPWLSLAFALVALLPLAQGARLIVARPNSITRKVLGSLTFVVSLAFVGITAFAFVHARQVPPALGAPQVGDKVPDFALADTTGQRVSLARLFQPAPGEALALPPKSVLLIFYRGYW